MVLVVACLEVDEIDASVNVLRLYRLAAESRKGRITNGKWHGCGSTVVPSVSAVAAVTTSVAPATLGDEVDSSHCLADPDVWS